VALVGARSVRKARTRVLVRRGVARLTIGLARYLALDYNDLSVRGKRHCQGKGNADREGSYHIVNSRRGKTIRSG
jgi:hypothetical protein